MIKKLATVIIPGFFVFIASVFGQTSIYSNAEKGFSIGFPDTWEKKVGYLGSTVIAFSPLDDTSDQIRANVNVVTETLPGKMSVEEYYRSNVGAMKKFLTDFQLLDKGQARLGNTTARWMVYSHRVKALNLKALVFMVVQNSRGFVITCSSVPEKFLKYQRRFEQIAKSFRLK